MARLSHSPFISNTGPSFRARTVQEGPGSFMGGQSGAMQAYQQQLAALLGHVDIPGVNQIGSGTFIAAPDSRMPFYQPQNARAGTPVTPSLPVNFNPGQVQNPFVQDEDSGPKDFLLQALLSLL